MSSINIKSVDRFTPENAVRHFELFYEIAKTEVFGLEFNADQLKKIELFIRYFNGDRSVEDTGLSLNKGLFVFGDFGTGKTTLFRILRRYMASVYRFHPNGFKSTSVEELIDHHVANETLKDFLRPPNLLINEFATEHDYGLKVYGSKISEILESFLMQRYELFTSKGFLIHATSNRNFESLTNVYDRKLSSRFAEMFNFARWKGKSHRQ
jgi:predicted ATPase